VAPPASSAPAATPTPASGVIGRSGPDPATSASAATAATTAATGWVIDPVPDGLRPAAYTNVEAGLDAPSGWGEVWATPDASRTTGRWFSLTLLPFRTVDPVLDPALDPALVIDVGGRRGVARTDDDGVVTLSYDAGSIDASRLVTLSSFGFSPDQLAELADSIAFIDDRPQMVDDRPEFQRPELLAGFEQLAAEPTDGDLVAQVVTGRRLVSATVYRTDDEGGITLVQEQRDGARPDDPLLALALHRYVIPPDGWAAPDSIDGADLVAGRVRIDGYDLVVVRWRIGDRTVSVLGTGGLGETYIAASRVRLAGADEWATLTRWAGLVGGTGDVAARLAPWGRGS
jgi:hypothetical protein